MPLDGLVFTVLAQELAGTIKNARIQGVYQPSATDLVLQLRQPGRSLHLLISVDPVLSRVHLTEDEFDNPLSPPPFCLLLRKHLIPGRIADVRQPRFERVLEIVVETRDESGGRTRRRLYAEVMGKNSNVILTDEDGTILDALRRVSGETNRYRELLPNRPYTPPPPQERLDPGTVGPEEFDRIVRLVPSDARVAQVLAERIAGFSPLAGREVVARAGLDVDATRDALTPGAIGDLFKAFREVVEAVESNSAKPCAVESAGEIVDFWLLPPCTVSGATVCFGSMNELVDWVYRRKAERELFARTQKRLKGLVDQHLRRLSRKAELQREELAAAAKAEEYRIAGDLLTAFLHRIQPGAASVELPNFYDGDKPVVIELDPRESPSANAQRYYRKYQKAKKTLEKAKEQLDETLAELAYLESVKVALELAASRRELDEIEAELDKGGYTGGTAGERPKSAKVRREPPSFLIFSSSDGFRILAGRNNRQNDLLTMEIAKADDVWLHAKEIPGAHVIIRTEGKAVPESTLFEAAMIAAYYSRARNSANVPVDYTLRRHVRKPRGARPGMVIYDHQRTLYVTPDPERLASLGPLAAAEPSSR